jgi:class 3 adenylate cyclase/tetratricopeptide (TPR) repeat protein
VSDDRGRSTTNGEARTAGEASIDDLLDRAVAAINRGDRAAAKALAGRVLAADGANTDAEDLLAAPSDPGEIRRLTIFFADLVDSTVMSTRLEPETYRLLVRRYRELVLSAVGRYEGHIGNTAGDGLLAVFGYPIAHEDDVHRAVHAGLEITRDVARLSEQAKRRFGIEVSVRVGVHRGLVYLDTAQDEVYGLAANLAARVSSLAPPGAVVVSDTVESLIRNNFELDERAPTPVKGVEEPVKHYRVVAERTPVRKPGHAPLVGRGRELTHLEKVWAQAQSGALGTPGVVLLGEAGIGKSRLAAAAAEMADATSSVVLELVGSPFHTDAGLYPIRTLLERRCGIDRNTDHAERLRLLDNEIRSCGLEQASALPLLAPVLGIEPRTGYEQVAAEGRKLYELIGHTVQSYLVACLGGAPGLVVAEDVHWFDSSTRDALGALLGAAGGKLLVVMTGRPGQWLSESWPHKSFLLTPLNDDQADALISALGPGLSADERAAVATRCDGVPFYIEQVVNGIDQTGVPESLYEPLFARLRASPTVVPVVEAAAVIGREIDRHLLCTVVDLSNEEFDDVIDQLEDALVLEPLGSDGWRFRHELLREVAAELAPPTVRRALHAKVADVLVGAGEPDWQMIAAHYEQADRFDEAAAAYGHACTDARRRGALAEAGAYLTRGLAQVDRASPGLDRDRRETAMRLERGLLTSAAEGYQSSEAASDFERCLRLSGGLTDDELSATLAALGNYYLVRADLRRAAQVIESLRKGSGEQQSIDILSGALAYLRGDFHAATAALDAAAVGRADAHQLTVDAEAGWLYRGLVALVRGDLAGAESGLARSAQAANGFAFPQGPYLHAYTRSMETWLRIEAGQLDRAAVVAAELMTEAERHGFDMWRLMGLTWRSAISALTAHGTADADPTVLAARIAIFTTSLDALRAMEVNIYTTILDAMLGRLLIAVGQPETARERLDIGLALARDSGMHFYDAELLRLRATTYDDPATREGLISEALQLSRSQSAALFELRSALDNLKLRGHAASAALADAVNRIPANSGWPELTQV